MPEHRRDQPSVSVVLPTYNSAQFVSRAIDSVLNQEGDHALELIIVDDCSHDGTPQLIQQRYGSDSRVTLIVTERNAGPGAARNQALALAKGEWIALVDADDAWTTDRLSALMPLCTSDVDILFDNIIGYDAAAEVRTDLLFISLPQVMTVPAMAADRAPGTTFNYGYLKPLIRRDFLCQANIRYPEVRISEDLLFYLEVLANGARTKATNEGFYLYTTSVGQSSGRRSTLSATVPDDELVSNLLDGLAAKYACRLGAAELESISSRADQLRRHAPLNRMYDDWTRGRYLTVARRCITDKAARQQLLHALSRRLRHKSTRHERSN